MDKALEYLVVGGGFAGLVATHLMQRAGKRVLLVEARDRVGGRALSVLDSSSGRDAPCDLGPSWIWPQQTLLLNAIRELGIHTFAQFAEGKITYQTQDGQVMTRADRSPMAGALRIDGGTQQIATQLRQRIAPETLKLQHRALSASTQDGRVSLSCHSPEGEHEYVAERLVLAVPPRLAATLPLGPELPPAALEQLRATPTWMAGHAKCFAVYPTPFWRDLGLCGSAFSQQGPLAEVHDASPADGQVGVLFGFVGLEPQTRAAWGRPRILREALAQLGRLFTEQAATPLATHYVDWSLDPHTAVDDDRVPQTRHPHYGLALDLAPPWQDRLFHIASECSFLDGGLIAGAFQAAHDFVDQQLGSAPQRRGGDGHAASMGWDWI